MHVCLNFIRGISYCPSINVLATSLLWQSLASLLNTLLLPCRNPTSTDDNRLALPEKDDIGALPEDFAIRGLSWAKKYFPDDWFSKDGEEEKYHELPSLGEQRKEIILWLACTISSNTWNVESLSPSKMTTYNPKEHQNNFFLSTKLSVISNLLRLPKKSIIALSNIKQLLVSLFVINMLPVISERIIPTENGGATASPTANDGNSKPFQSFIDKGIR